MIDIEIAMALLIHTVLLSGVIFITAEMMQGIRLKSFFTAIVVAIVYSLIDVLLGTLLKVISFPFILLSLGLFVFLINAFMLWLTDQLIEDFEIQGFGTTVIAAIIITLANLMLGLFY
jgi:putative membrane protein